MKYNNVILICFLVFVPCVLSTHIKEETNDLDSDAPLKAEEILSNDVGSQPMEDQNIDNVITNSEKEAENREQDVSLDENTLDVTKEGTDDSHLKEETVTDEKQNGEKVDYKTGSICSYCKYCKHCDDTVCETKCPCKETDDKEICETCKYCKYCFVCGTICDSVCNPGGMLDSLTGSLYDSLPSFTDKSKEDVDGDIEKAKDFIKEYL